MKILSCLAVCALLSAGCSKSGGPGDLKFPGMKFAPPDLASHRHTLDNGVIVFIVEDSKLPVFDIHARFKTGGLMETPAEKGFAAMTAGLLEDGGVKGISADSLDELLEFHAIGLSAGADFTGATVSLSCLAEKADLGLDLFNRVIREPAFEEKKLALAKQQAVEAIRHRFDAPANTLRIAGRFALYGRDAWSGLLSEKDIGKISRESLRKFYQAYFRPENMVVGVSGRFSTEEMLKKLNATLGAWKGSGVPASKFPKLPVDYKPRFYFVEKDINQAYVRIGGPLIERPHPDYYPIVLMNWVLGGASFTSRISKKVREMEGLAYDAGSSVSCEYFYPGTFNVGLQTKSATAAYAIDLVYKEIREFLKNGALEKELAAGKQSLTDAFPSGFQNGDKTARAFTGNQYVGETDDNISAYCGRINAVTLEDVKRAAEKYIRPENLSVIIVGRFSECEKGDNAHPAKLMDFGTPVKMTEKELNRALGGE